MPELAVRSGSAPKDPPRTPVPEHPLIGTTPLSDSSPACAWDVRQLPSATGLPVSDAERGLPDLVREGSERAWGPPTAPGPAQTCDGVCVGVAFRIRALRRRPKRVLSRLHTQPARAPVNASPAASRPPTHDSGSGWIATPFLCGSFIRSFPPVYPGARSVPELHSLGAIRLVDTRNPLTRRPGSPRGWLVPRSKPRGRLPRRVRLPGPRR